MFQSIILILSAISFTLGKSVQENVHNQSLSEYQLDKGWPDKAVSELQVKGSGITIDSSGNIVLLHRGFQGASKSKNSLIRETTVAVIDRNSGKILREWGSNKFLTPHGIYSDQNDAIFITDVVMHQIFKFDWNNATKLWHNEPSVILGKAFVPGFDSYHFCSPSDVVEDPLTGNFFVADGYCHNRVVKFDKHGKFMIQFGAGSSDPSILPIPFNVTHALALAHRNNANGSQDELQTILLVADRDNSRIQVFDLQGVFLYEIGSQALGSEHAMILSMATTNSTTKGYEFGKVFIIKGHVPVGEAQIIILGLHENNFTRISSFPITKHKPSAPVNVNATSTKDVKLETPHDIALAKNGKEIYVVETVNELTLKRFVWTEIKTPTKGQNTPKGFAMNSNVPENLAIIMCIFLISVLH